MVTPFFHALWILCVFGAAVFAAASARPAAYVIGLAAGFTAAVGFFQWRPEISPDSVLVSACTAAAAAVYLFRPRYRLASAFVGGALAGLCSTLSEVLGFPGIAGIVLAGAVPAVMILLARRSAEFASEQLCDEGMLGVLVLATVTALAPGILAGWQSAIALNIEGESSVTLSIPAWTLLFACTSMLMGGVYSLWRRR